MAITKGLHLWFVRFGYMTLFITTEFNSPCVAIKKAQKAAKDAGIIAGFDSLEHKGTIDA